MNITVNPNVASNNFSKYVFKSAAIAHDNYQDVPEEDWSEACAEDGGFNPYTGEMTPLKLDSSEMAFHDVLDHITAAVESGVLNRRDWPKQLLASEADWEAFYDGMEEYCDLWRLNDRWMMAVETLLGPADEGEFLTGHSIVEEFRDAQRKM